MAETATHAFCLDLLAGKNKFLLGEMPLQQQPSPFPLSRRLPADVLDAPLFAQDLLSCDLPWWDHHQGNTSRSQDFLLPADRGSGLWAIPPSHSGREERKTLFTKRNTRRRPRSELWRASQELLLFSPRMIFGTASPSAVPVQPPRIPRGAHLGFISKRDLHADGKQCSSTLSYPTWDLHVYNTQADDHGGVLQLLLLVLGNPPSASASWVLPACARKGQRRILFLSVDCQ